jgi:hypothetical protein
MGRKPPNGTSVGSGPRLVLGGIGGDKGDVLVSRSRKRTEEGIFPRLCLFYPPYPPLA